MSKREQIKINYDKTANTLKRLSQGDRATLVCNGDRKPVTVVAQAPQPRSYIVEDERGGRYRRTRSQLITRTASSAVTRETARQPPKSEFSSRSPSIISMTGFRRRRRKPKPIGSQNAAVTTQAQGSPASSESVMLDVSGDYESPVSTRDQSCTSSSHEVPIERSKERTARMLTHRFHDNE
ncbi:hypothetical protein HF086_008505 [Spodoptera exigua]|uniref:Uncharacterized protein n=1 Tax=Spodoptera exigua TaxID=7107 RepID=A0A922M9V0_SPOEX|nr:hypothetical protein HF086_008505 [Spodoptera exigua]